MKNEDRKEVDPCVLHAEGSKYHKRNRNHCEVCGCYDFFKSDREELRHLGFWQDVKDVEFQNFWVCAACGDLSKRQVRSRSKITTEELNELVKRLAPHLLD
jgi:hypothetical protein